MFSADWLDLQLHKLGKFNCSNCLMEVVVGTPAEFRSDEVNQQMTRRLCTGCLEKRKQEAVN